MALSALLSVPSFDSDKKIIRFGNNLSHALKERGNYELYHAIAKALGRLATMENSQDRVEFELNRSLEWLRSEKGSRRLASVLVLREFSARCGSQLYAKIYGGNGDDWIERGKEFLEGIFAVVRDDSLVVRVCAADALEGCLEVLMERRGEWMIVPLCGLFSEVMGGLHLDSSGGTWTQDSDMDGNETKKKKVGLSLMNYTYLSNRKAGLHDDIAVTNAHGSLLAVSAFLKHAKNFLMPRECTLLFSFFVANAITSSPPPLIASPRRLTHMFATLSHSNQVSTKYAAPS